MDTKKAAIIEAWFAANHDVFGSARVRTSKSGYPYISLGNPDAFDYMMSEEGSDKWATATARSFNKMLKAIGYYWDLDGPRILLEKL